MFTRILAPALLRAENAPTPPTLPGRYGFATVRAEANHLGIPCQCLLDHGSPPSFIVQTLSCSWCPHIPSFMVPALGIFCRILVSQNQPKLSTGCHNQGYRTSQIKLSCEIRLQNQDSAFLGIKKRSILVNHFYPFISLPIPSGTRSRRGFDHPPEYFAARRKGPLTPGPPNSRKNARQGPPVLGEKPVEMLTGAGAYSIILTPLITMFFIWLLDFWTHFCYHALIS